MQPLIDLKIAWIQIAAKTIFRIEELAKYVSVNRWIVFNWNLISRLNGFFHIRRK